MYVPLPAQLTNPIEYPASFTSPITTAALIDRLFELYDLLDRANADRARAVELQHADKPSPSAGSGGKVRDHE